MLELRCKSDDFLFAAIHILKILSVLLQKYGSLYIGNITTFHNLIIMPSILTRAKLQDIM